MNTYQKISGYQVLPSVEVQIKIISFIELYLRESGLIIFIKYSTRYLISYIR
ncbi:hypothetical protein GFK82_00030 [Candidatus Steffania adelgidicola]|nr:hypothetical protein GFK82_00030 [Candidatus Steffania adelgidicola]